jgi:uncharacterized membrane protein YfcA
VQQGTELPWLTIASLIIGLWIGTGLGSWLANRMSQRALRMTLIAVIAGMAVFMAFKAAT